MSFVLANPVLEGGSSITSNQNSRHAAAKDIWFKFSKNIKNFTPKFYFSIKNTESGSYSHFRVSEAISKNNRVGIKMKRLEKSKINNGALKQFDNNQLQLESDEELSVSTGGDRHKYKKYDLADDDDDDDDSSSSDSDSDSDTKIKQRKSKGLKLLYAPGIYNVSSVSIPIISTSYAPSVNLVGLGFGLQPTIGVGVSNLNP